MVVGFCGERGLAPPLVADARALRGAEGDNIFGEAGRRRGFYFPSGAVEIGGAEQFDVLADEFLLTAVVAAEPLPGFTGRFEFQLAHEAVPAGDFKDDENPPGRHTGNNCAVFAQRSNPP